MKILITARELINRGVWDEASILLSINPYAVNEGQMDGDDELTLTEDQAVELRILPKPGGEPNYWQ